MDENEWFVRFLARKEIGYGKNGLDFMYGFKPCWGSSPDLSLVKFVYQFHDDLMNSSTFDSEYSHIFEDGDLIPDGIWLKVSLVNRVSDQNPDEIWYFCAICRNESRDQELIEEAEFDHIHKAVDFVDYPMGLFSMCKNLIMHMRNLQF